MLHILKGIGLKLGGLLFWLGVKVEVQKISQHVVLIGVLGLEVVCRKVRRFCLLRGLVGLQTRWLRLRSAQVEVEEVGVGLGLSVVRGEVAEEVIFVLLVVVGRI